MFDRRAKFSRIIRDQAVSGPQYLLKRGYAFVSFSLPKSCAVSISVATGT